jgi:hypothetical protein
MDLLSIFFFSGTVYEEKHRLFPRNSQILRDKWLFSPQNTNKRGREELDMKPISYQKSNPVPEERKINETY